MPAREDDGMTMTSKIVLAGVGVLLSVTASMATYTGRATNEKLDQLNVALIGLTTRLAVLEKVVEGLPPAEWRSKIDLQDAMLDAHERRIDRLERGE